LRRESRLAIVASRMTCRLTPQFSGGALPSEARRERIMK
jgi:hypothetical protein